MGVPSFFLASAELDKLDFSAKMGRPRRAGGLDFSTSLKDFQARGAWVNAVDLLESIRQQRVRTREVDQNILISSCAKRAAWKASFSVLEGMQQMGISASAVTKSTLIHALGKVSFWHFSLDELNVTPNIVCFNASMAAATDWFQALASLQQVIVLAIANRTSFNTVISALADHWQGLQSRVSMV